MWARHCTRKAAEAHKELRGRRSGERVVCQLLLFFLPVVETVDEVIARIANDLVVVA